MLVTSGRLQVLSIELEMLNSPSEATRRRHRESACLTSQVRYEPGALEWRRLPSKTVTSHPSSTIHDGETPKVPDRSWLPSMKKFVKGRGSGRPSRVRRRLSASMSFVRWGAPH